MVVRKYFTIKDIGRLNSAVTQKKQTGVAARKLLNANGVSAATPEGKKKIATAARKALRRVNAEV